MKKFAIIGGTGLTQLSGLEISNEISLDTPFGKPSAAFKIGRLNAKEIVFLARHGDPHTIPPHKINYRANIWGLKDLGVTDIIAVAAVGGITPEMTPSRIVIADQIIDYSYGRAHTFYEDDLLHVTHIDFTEPYSESLRQQLLAAAAQTGLDVYPRGVYGCTQGPRLETPAEIRRMERDGCDLVGMTGMPEAALARELDLNYAACAVVANWAAGKSAGEITMAEIEINLTQGMSDVKRLLTQCLVSD